MKFKIVTFFLLISVMSTITATASDYTELRTILKDGNSAVGKIADLKLKFVYLTDKDNKLFMANDSPACNVWIKYNKDQASGVKEFVKDERHDLKIKITSVGRIVVEGDLIEINSKVK